MIKNNVTFSVFIALMFVLWSCAMPHEAQSATSLFLEQTNNASVGVRADTPTAVFVGSWDVRGSSGYPERSVRVTWVDMKNLAVIKSQNFPILIKLTTSPRVSPDGKFFVAETVQGEVSIWRTEDGTKITTLEKARAGVVKLGRTKDELIVGNYIWSLSDGKKIGEIVSKPSNSPGALRKVGSEDGTLEVRLEDYKTDIDRAGLEIREIANQNPLHSLALNEDTFYGVYALFSRWCFHRHYGL